MRLPAEFHHDRKAAQPQSQTDSRQTDGRTNGQTGIGHADRQQGNRSVSRGIVGVGTDLVARHQKGSVDEGVLLVMRYRQA